MTWTSTPPAAATPAGQSFNAAAPAAAVPDSQSFNAAAPAPASVSGITHDSAAPVAASVAGTEFAFYESDFSAGIDGWGNPVGAAVVGQVDTIGPAFDVRNDCLEIEFDVGDQMVQVGHALTIGKTYSVEFDYYFPPVVNTELGVSDSLTVYDGAVSMGSTVSGLDEWHTFRVTFTATTTDLFVGDSADGIYPGDTILLRRVRITAAPAAATPASQSFDSAAPGAIAV